MCPTEAALNLKLRFLIEVCFQDFNTQHKPGYAKMTVLALSLFVFWILADYSDASFSFNDFTFFTDRFYRWSNFHLNPPFLSLGRMAIVVSPLYGTLYPAGWPWCEKLMFLRTKKALHKSSFYSIALHFIKCKQFLPVFSGFFSFRLKKLQKKRDCFS